MAHEKLKPNFVFDEEKIEKLKQLAPECFEDGKINFETLKQNLGHWSDEEDESLEHFGLFWPGKKLARRAVTLPPEGTLEPVFGDGLKPDGTSDKDGNNPSKNIFIEGENLEVLKLLQKSYADKIKMIYIDPPYNTGNDFVYDDDFTEPLQEYLRRTGQIDEEGKSLTTNKRSDGRFHSKWLSMMYPRLRLARNLLKEDGVIFVSIDDNEVHNLHILMNEIFGEENFIGQWNWFKSATPPNLSLKIKKNIEYILCYQKTRSNEKFKGLKKESKSDDPLTKPQNSLKKLVFPPKSILINLPDQEIEPGFYGTEKFPNELKNKLIIKDNLNFNEVTFKNRFIWTQEKLEEELENETLIRIASKSLVLSYKKGDYDEEVPPNLIDKSVGVDTTENAGRDLVEIFEGKKVFDYPKPISLIEYLMNFNISNDEIVMDFFAGSGSTGHAVWSLLKNKEIHVNWILVQFPELLKDEKEQKVAYDFCIENELPTFISELTKERLRRVHNKLNPEKGFRCLKLASSNYKVWKDFKGTDIDQLIVEFEEEANSPFAPDWNKNKLFIEILLIEGFPLDAKVDELKIGDNAIKKVTSELVSNQLLICMDEKIGTTLISDLKIDHNSSFICLDSAITNQDKLRLSDKGLIKTI